jgi:hypothetical protein
VCKILALNGGIAPAPWPERSGEWCCVDRLNSPPNSDIASFNHLIGTHKD